MTPLITIQMLGLVYQRKLKRSKDLTPEEEADMTDEIIDYTKEDQPDGEDAEFQAD